MMANLLAKLVVWIRITSSPTHRSRRSRHLSSLIFMYKILLKWAIQVIIEGTFVPFFRLL